MKGIRVQLICVGKMKEKFYIDAAAEYVKRLSAYCKLQVVELPEERLPSNPSQARIDAALEKEAAAIRAKLAPGASLVALCVEGRMRSSEELSGLLSDWSSRGGKQPGLSDRRLLRPCPLPQGPGVGQAVHVPHDLSPPSGPGDAAGAALPQLQDRRRLQLPQVGVTISRIRQKTGWILVNFCAIITVQYIVYARISDIGG